MANASYTDADLRREAARQYAELASKPDLVDVGHDMQSRPEWKALSCDDFHDASNEVFELLDSAVDMSRWAINLSASHLASTTELAWGHPTNWDLAVQLAHRPRLDDELHDALVKAVRAAIDGVLDSRGIRRDEILQGNTRLAVTR